MMLQHNAYKDSGIEWLGKIPEHWEVKRIKQMLSPNKLAIKTGPFGSDLKFEDYVDDGIKVYNQRNVLDENFDSGAYFINENKFMELRTCEIYPKDLLITTRGTIGRSAIFPEGKRKGILHPCLMRMQINEKICLNEYLKIVINDSVFFLEQLLYISNATTIEVIYSNFLREMKLALPPISEQKEIIRYSRNRLSSLDQLFLNLTEQIEKIKEIRQIEINNTVTKGLNPNVKMKDSGIEWLGDIPEHWKVKRVKNVCKVNPKKGDSGYSPNSTMLVAFLPMESVNEHGEFDVDIKLPIDELWSGFTYFKRGDVVVAKITPCFENGKGACLDNLSTEIGFGTTEFHVLRSLSNEILNRFIYYITKSEMFMQIGEALMTGAAGQKRVPTEFIESFKIAVPSITEQADITKYLDIQLSKLDHLVKNIEQQIEKIKEIRKIEIYNAVTGKIKVV